MLILNMLVNYIPLHLSYVFHRFMKVKVIKKLLKGYTVLVSIVLANYSIPNLSVQSVTSDDDDFSTDSWGYHLPAFPIFEIMFAKQYISM